MGKNKEEIDRKIGNVFRKGEVWGTEEQKNRGTGEQRNRRTEEQKNRGTEEQRNRGTEEQGNRGTGEQKNRGTEEQRNRRTEEQKNRGTEEQRNRRTEEQRNRRTEEVGHTALRFAPRRWKAAIRLFASLREGGKRPDVSRKKNRTYSVFAVEHS